MDAMIFRKSSWFIIALAALVIGCTQPDSVITAKIKASMAVDSTVKSSHIEVSTQDKVVTLAGNLNSQAEKDRALEIARPASGSRTSSTCSPSGPAPSRERLPIPIAPSASTSTTQ